MLCFPQLSTGSMAQYPASRRRIRRSVVNVTPGGARVAWTDPAVASVQWELPLAGLTAAEMAAIEGLFEASKGRETKFLFLDPLDNLLGWSEDLGATVWTADPMLTRTPGRTDPFGTTRATRLVNAGQATQRLTQMLNAPSWFHYCFSLRVRSDSVGTARLVFEAGGTTVPRTVQTGPEWRDAWLSAKGSGTQETVTVGLEFDPGASADVFGLQLEAQIAASPYKKTAGRGGLYPASRFCDDRIRSKAEGVNWFSTTVRITSREEA